MNKNVCVFLMLSCLFGVFSDEKWIFGLDSKSIDFKNYYWNTTLKSIETNNEHTGELIAQQYILNCSLNVKNKNFIIDTVLIPHGEKDKFITLNELPDNPQTSKPIKIFEKEDFKKITESIKNEKDKNIFLTSYKEDTKYYVLNYAKGKTQKTTDNTIRKILESINYSYDKVIGWKVSYGAMNVTGIIDDEYTILHLKVGSKKLEGNYDVMSSDYLLDGISLKSDMKSTSIEHNYNNKIFSADMKLVSYNMKTKDTNVELIYSLPELSDEEMTVILFDRLFLNYISRY